MLLYFNTVLLLWLVVLQPAGSQLKVHFNEGTEQLSTAQKETITTQIKTAEKRIRALLPNLPEEISVYVDLTSMDFNLSGGVNGRAERHSPAEVVIEISNSFEGGLDEAIETGLISVIYHEFHHLSRGWAIKDNKYSIEIYSAAVNEGLAIVFAETYTNIKLPWNNYPPDVEQWVEEILTLSKDANYSQWMFQHPDGRLGIGYKAGKYIIEKAMENSGKDILQLSKLSVKRILKLAGYKNKD